MIGEKSSEETKNQESQLAGPFIVSLEQTDRTMRDDNIQMSNKINSYRISLPESLGTQDLSKQSSAYSGAFAPISHVSQQVSTASQQQQSSADQTPIQTRSMSVANNQLFDQLRSEQSQAIIEVHSYNRRSLGSKDLQRNNSLDPLSLEYSQSSASLFNQQQMGSLIASSENKELF